MKKRLGKGKVPCCVLLIIVLCWLSAFDVYSHKAGQAEAAVTAPIAAGSFPDDIPILEGAEQIDIPKDFKVDGDRRSKMISYSVKTEMVKVERLYKEYMRIKGYTEDVNKPGDKVLSLSGSLNETTLTIAAAVDAANGALIHVKITWTGKKAS